MAIAAGTRFNQYEILAPLGAGGMGEVYRAIDTRLNRYDFGTHEAVRAGCELWNRDTRAAL